MGGHLLGWPGRSQGESRKRRGARVKNSSGKTRELANNYFLLEAKGSFQKYRRAAVEENTKLQTNGGG